MTGSTTAEAQVVPDQQRALAAQGGVERQQPGLFAHAFLGGDGRPQAQKRSEVDNPVQAAPLDSEPMSVRSPV